MVLPVQNPSRILCAGDTHSSIPHWEYIIEIALDNNCDLILQVGDLSYFPHTAEGIKFLSFLSYTLDKCNLPCWFLPGNHENYDALYQGEWEITPQGVWKLMPQLYYIPRGLRWNWQGYKFLGLGGAVSPDKDDRLRWERRSNTERTLWWPEEEIQPGDVARALESKEHIDIMFTHDVPVDVNIPHSRNFVADPQAYANRQSLQIVMDTLRPKRLIHGHFHTRYTVEYKSYHDYTTIIDGLSRDGHGDRSWLILDLPKGI